MHREQFEFHADPNGFVAGMRRSADAARSLVRVFSQNAHPLDRVERNSEDPHTWPGDQA